MNIQSTSTSGIATTRYPPMPTLENMKNANIELAIANNAKSSAPKSRITNGNANNCNETPPILDPNAVKTAKRMPRSRL